jgi:hypothetical protein
MVCPCLDITGHLKCTRVDSRILSSGYTGVQESSAVPMMLKLSERSQLKELRTYFVTLMMASAFYAN